MKTIILVLGLFSSLAALAFDLASVPATFFPSLDVQKMHSMELQRMTKGEAPHFAVPHSTAIDISNAADWEEENDMMVWRHRVTAPNAVSLNFGFSEFYLSQNAKVAIFSADFSDNIREFSAKDNNAARELWTPVLMSDDAIVEVRVPREELSQLRLVLGTVGQGFRTFAQNVQKSGSCNIDVVCKEGDEWRNEINAVAVISTGGSSFCTGFMVNNTKNDKTPYFMTANHCGIRKDNAPSLVTYWNYQATTCGGSRDGKLKQFTTGSTFLAAGSKSDFTIVKLNSAPSAEYGVKYAGWDRSGVDAQKAIAIHHPNTDEKSISFSNKPTTITDYLGETVPGTASHIRVLSWDVGTTEPGSSGSPLFDQNHRVIGQLHGGYAACDSITSDYYGRLNVSWEGGGSAATRLKDHLDADGTGATTVDTI